MGNPFRITWDDFTGGHFVGQNDSQQPKNTWTGKNVNVAAHDGALVASNLVWQSPMRPHASLTDVTVANNSFHVDNSVLPGVALYVSDTILCNEITYTLFSYQSGGVWYAKAVTTTGIPLQSDNLNLSLFSRIVQSPTGWTAVAGQPGPLVGRTTAAAFIAGNTLYTIIGSGAFSSTATLPVIFSGGYISHRLVRYGSRLVASNNNTIYFSDAFNDASWPTLNFIVIGEDSNSIIEALVPRYDDLIVVTTGGVYSVNGTLSVNASVRKVSSQLDIQSFYQYYTDTPVDSLDNAIYYIDQSVIPYYANIKQLYGNQISVEAFQRMDRQLSGSSNSTMPSLVTTNNNCLVAMWSKLGTGQTGFNALIRKQDRRYVKLEQDPLTFTPGTANTTDYALRYSAVKDKQSQNLGFYNNVLVAQYASYKANGGFPVTRFSVSFGVWQPEQINAGFLPGPPSGFGSTATTNTATPGTVELSPIETEKPSKILRVYVEAELNLDFYTYNDFRGTAFIKATVENRAVDDISFTATAPSSSTQMLASVDLTTINGLTSQAINGTWVPTIPYPTTDDKKRLSATRVLRFDPTDSGYGYKHNIVLEIQGFRVKRVWAEGESR